MQPVHARNGCFVRKISYRIIDFWFLIKFQICWNVHTGLIPIKKLPSFQPNRSRIYRSIYKFWSTRRGAETIIVSHEYVNNIDPAPEKQRYSVNSNSLARHDKSRPSRRVEETPPIYPSCNLLSYQKSVLCCELKFENNYHNSAVK